MRRKPIEILTLAESFELLKYICSRDTAPFITTKTLRNTCLTLLMLDAGLRVAEAVKLKIPDVWYNGLMNTAVRVSPYAAKRNIERIIPMTVRLSKNLSDYLKTCNIINEHDAECFLFPSSRTGFPITTRMVQHFIKRAGWKALGRSIHPHILRHTFGTRLMKQSPARVVQQLLGHAGLETTQIYMHPNTEDLTNAIEGLNNDQTDAQTQTLEHAKDTLADSKGKT